jgi:hypothetical protein
MASLYAVGATAAEPPQGAMLRFPIVIEPPSAMAVEGIASGGALFSQPFRSTAAVRLSAPYQLADTANGGGRVITFAQGALFVGGLIGEDEVFCAPGSNGARGITAKGDVGVCFRDDDHDGTFDGQLVVNRLARANGVYELNLMKMSRLQKSSSSWDAATAPYVRLKPEEIPAGQVKVTYFYVDPPLGKPQAFASLAVCAPDALTAHPELLGQCGVLLRPEGGKLFQEPTRLDLESAAGQALSFGLVQGTIKIAPGGLGSMTATSALASGPAQLALAAISAQFGDPSGQTSIFALQGAKTASAERP